ncbi:MAG: SemiSWEET transporter [Candidatus Omnitrophota bacterium]|jgi:MtN3 and saliva related transmembrane protein
MIWSIIGFLAATLTMFSFIPQIVKVIKTKSARDVSIITIIQLTIGVFLWFIYGLARRDPVIIMANTVTFITLIILLVFYYKYGRVKCQS